jgi:methylmalonyl-CoA mutase
MIFLPQRTLRKTQRYTKESTKLILNLVISVKQKRLFEEFPPVTTKEWMEKIAADLKGADFNQRLVWKTGEGFDVMPFYRREDIENLNHVDSGIFKSDSRWLIRQNIKVTDYSEANRKALAILMKGVDSLGFIIEDPGCVSKENLTVLLDGIDPSGTEINFLSNGKAREIISYLINITEKNGFGNSSVRGAVEADPLGKLIMNGTLCIPVDQGLDYLASLTKETGILPNYRNLQINGSNFANTGTGVVRELAFSISMAVEYLSQLTSRGITPDEIATRMRFSFGIGTDYFMEIAKLRAARILWSLVADACGQKNPGSFRMEIHSVTKVWNDTVTDPYINMLRTQTEAMSAVLGGTDSLTVNPFDISKCQADEFSERIARNQQLILKEEAWFDKVADPSAGSWYIENLTSLIAENAWKLFIEIENMGGFLSALDSGFVIQNMKGFAVERTKK